MCYTPFFAGSSQPDAEILSSGLRSGFMWIFHISNPPSGEMQLLISLNIDFKIIKHRFKADGKFWWVSDYCKW